jgi:PilZ domain
MGSIFMRRSDRVSLTLPIEASGRDVDGHDFSEQARTAVINRHGGVIVLHRKIASGQEIVVRRTAGGNSVEGRFRVLGEIGAQDDGFVYAVALLEPEKDFWNIDFPSPAQSGEALARVLVECSHCRRREVAYLNEVELKGYEAFRGIARNCGTCAVPTIWTPVHHEPVAKAPAPKAPPDPEPPQTASAGGEVREKSRFQTRLTGYIRQAGYGEERVVCENASADGICFRSQKPYVEGTRVEVAFPYEEGNANIFIPARIVYSQRLPSAGLFRHGLEYIRYPN